MYSYGTKSMIWSIDENVFDFRVVLALNKELIENYMAKLESKKHLRVEPDQECLRWTPLISNYNISEEEKKAEKEVKLLSMSGGKYMIL